MAEPPDYDNAQEHFLNPNLVFSALTYRLHYKERDRAFARAIVDFIANYVQRQGEHPEFEGSRGWSYSGKTELVWDTKIGYPAVEAFKTKRVPYIVEEAKLDLCKRGFTVEKLRLVFGNSIEDVKGVKDICTKTALECKCEYHGIYVQWKLGLGA
jgi:hypothetical protein